VQLAAERFDQRAKRVLVAAAGGLDQGLEIWLSTWFSG
jgi:hypothetical protein